MLIYPSFQQVSRLDIILLFIALFLLGISDTRDVGDCTEDDRGAARRQFLISTCFAVLKILQDPKDPGYGSVIQQC